MRVVGVDLAASAATTAVAVLDDLTLLGVQVDVTDDALVNSCRDMTKIGIDCPLGWPQPFVDFVVAAGNGVEAGAAATPAERARYVYRTTDLRVIESCRPLRPLSVSADRIAHVALRCAALLPRLERPVDRSGAGRVVEVYPAASLWAWGLPYRSYKRDTGAESRTAIVTALSAVVDFGAHRELCLRSDHALDAVIAALTARAAALGLVTRPGEADLPGARAEGWIAVPTVPPAELR